MRLLAAHLLALIISTANASEPYYELRSDYWNAYSTSSLLSEQMQEQVTEEQCNADPSAITSENSINSKFSCELLMSTDICKNAEPKDGLKTCISEPDYEDLTYSLSGQFDMYTSCSIGVVNAFSDMAKGMWAIVKFFEDGVFEWGPKVNNFTSSAKNILTNEYYMQQMETKKPEEWFVEPTFLDLTKTASNKVGNFITDFLEKEFAEFHCYNTIKQQEIVCKLYPEFVATIAGGGFIALKTPAFSNKIRKSIQSHLGRAIGKTPRGNLGESVIKKQLYGESYIMDQSKKLAIEKAHLVGKGKVGADGSMAKVGNYKWSHIREKYLILKEAGFSPLEIRLLMENAVVGVSPKKIPAMFQRLLGRVPEKPKQRINENSNLHLVGDQQEPATRFVSQREKQELIPMHGDKLYDSARDAFNTSDFYNNSPYYSVELPDIRGRQGFRVLKVNEDKKSVQVELDDGTRRQLSAAEWETVKFSETAVVNALMRAQDSLTRVTLYTKDGKRHLIGRFEVDNSSKNKSEWYIETDSGEKLYMSDINMSSVRVTNEIVSSTYRVNNYVERDGFVYVVDPNSDTMKEMLGYGLYTVEKETGIPPGASISGADVDRIHKVWVEKVVPYLEDSNKNNAYGNLRDKLMNKNGELSLDEVIDNKAAVCLELSMGASCLLNEYNGLRPKLHGGYMENGIDGHAWVGMYDNDGNLVRLLDSNYTKQTHTSWDEYNNYFIDRGEEPFTKDVDEIELFRRMDRVLVNQRPSTPRQ